MCSSVKILISIDEIETQEEQRDIDWRGKGMKDFLEALPPESKLKKRYSSPKITTYGKVEEITGWIGGPWGEFFNGPISGWNPGDDPPRS